MITPTLQTSVVRKNMYWVESGKIDFFALPTVMFAVTTTPYIRVILRIAVRCLGRQSLVPQQQ